MLHVSATPLDLRTRRPFGIARGTRETFANLVVSLRDGDLVGYGEAAPNARYGESREDDVALLARLAPEIADLEGPAQVEALCAGIAQGAAAPALRAALSAAAWDLAGKRAGEPVWRFFAPVRPEVRTSLTVAIGPPKEMLAAAREAATRFRTLKVKLGFEGDVGVAARLAAALPDVRFRYDANEGWDRERAAAALAVLAEHDAELVEQPLPARDLEGVAWLRERCPVPLYADEAVLGLGDLAAVAEAYDGVVVKLAKCGGLAEASALVAACRERGLGVLVGCMVESSLGVAAALPVAALADHVDLDGPLLLESDPFTGLEVEGDVLRAGAAPGLGVSPADGA